MASWTELHEAAKRGQVDEVRHLLAQGADPNAREPGDNTYPLHWAAAHGHLEVARALLDAGGDVHGIGDVHALDVIGWAAFYHDPDVAPGTIDPARRALIDLLVERGARHHVFSALSIGDPDLLRSVIEQHPDTLGRRLSRFEHGLTPLHFAIDRKRYDLLDLLIELGADLDAVDGHGHTALAAAMFTGDREAARRLQAAGARPPAMTAPADFTATMAGMAASVTKNVPMISVPDVATALDWYVSIGFKELGRYGENGVVNFGIVSFGGAELMFTPRGTRGTHDVSLWFYTDRIDAFYQLLTARQMAAAQAALTGEGDPLSAIEFEQHIEDMFYGARQFGIRDPNGYLLYFIQSIETQGPSNATMHVP